MRRKIYDRLLEWKRRSNGRTAALIDGARRSGKTYIAEEFARNEYRSAIVIDFSKASKRIKDSFDDDAMDMDLLLNKISLEYGTKLYERESVIVFDEVQRFPRAREMIKHLVQDGRYDYIETGSLLSITTNIEGITIPSEERHMTLYPMDFEEFLWALGDESSIDLLRGFYETGQPLGPGAHHRLMNLLRQYILVGGMPQAVEVYVETKDFDQVDDVKRDILDLYRTDVGRFAPGYQQIVREMFDAIPSNLNTKDKIFNPKVLSTKPSDRDRDAAFLWLTDAMVANACYNATDPSVGLSMYTERSTLKLYMADTGLLVTHTISEIGMDRNKLYMDLLSDRLNVNEGMFMENVVAQMLRANGHKLYFYRRRDSNNREDEMEVDFMVMKDGKVCPVEVKSSDNLKHESLNKFRRKFGKRLGQAYILCIKDLKEDDGIRYLPAYMAIFF